jgi:predicted HAD superfamily Cof-like phosphohydrolase
MSNYDDVYEFHTKYGLLVGTKPRKLTQRKLKERIEFLNEEFNEFCNASGVYYEPGIGFQVDTDENQDINEQADALIDLVYVAMGTAVMMGLPWQELWDDVQRANMSKVRGTTKRGHAVDVTKPEGWVGPKPEGWVGPKTGEILDRYGYEPTAPEVDDPHHQIDLFEDGYNETN